MNMPDWVKTKKQKGTEIRCFNGNYYLYQVSSKWDAKKKRAQKITGKFLGKITVNGLVPPKVEKIKQAISIKEFGASCLIQNMNKDIIEHLKELFPYDWKEIFIISFLRLLHQSPIKNLELLYRNSYLQEELPKATLGPKSITNMFKNLGDKREMIVSFFKKFLQGNEHVLFDVTNIISKSKNLSINHLGFNNSNIFDPQINLMYIFSTDRKMPIYYRILPGNIREIKAFKNCIKESGLKNVTIIADKGFHSEENIKALQDGLNYIIPLKRSSRLINYDKIKVGNKNQFDGYFTFENRVIWHYSYNAEDQKIIVFLDVNLKSQEEKDYLFRIENSYEGYTQDTFFKKQFSFGTLAVTTNLKNTASKTYQYLKARNHIEVMFDAFKHTINADRSYMRDEKGLESWMFINHLALVYYYRLYQLLMSKDLLRKYSPKDVLLHLSQVRKIKINNEWITSEITHKTKQLLENLGIHIT